MRESAAIEREREREREREGERESDERGKKSVPVAVTIGPDS